MDNGLLFRMTQPTSRSTTRSHCTKQTNQNSEHQGKWKCNGAMVDKCNQRGVLWWHNVSFNGFWTNL